MRDSGNVLRDLRAVGDLLLVTLNENLSHEMTKETLGTVLSSGILG